MSIKKDILWRVGLIYIVIFGFALIIASKVVFLQFIDVEEWKKKAEESRVGNFIIPAHRGDIYTSDLRLLASSIPYYQVRMDFKVPDSELFNENVDSLALCLSQLFEDKSQSAYLTELKNAYRKGERYYLLKQNINYLQLKEMKEFPILRKGRLGGGFIPVSRTMRVRPHGDLARRTIGFVTESSSDSDVGLEGAYGDTLGGKDGFKRMQKASGGVWIPVSDKNEIEPEDGRSIVTTLDIDLQDVAHHALSEQLRLHQAVYGSVILMEVATGDIKAIVNLTKSGDDYKEIYNYAVGASTEPGSTFKLPALITALEDGYVDLDDTIDTGNGIFDYYDIKIRDDSYYNGGYGKLSVKQVFEKSSNVGMAKIITSAYKKNPHKFVDRLYKMGLNEKLMIEIPGEGTPLINYPGDELWSGVSLAQMAYGYEVELTPLQILTFYNAIANDGKMVKPRFVKEIRDHGKIEERIPVKVVRPVICSKSTLKKAHIMLEGVVEHGTATNLKASNFKIAGKTGTTQIYNIEAGSYKGKGTSYQASFAGYFPASEPKYSCIVVINSPSRDVYYGNQVAGPVFLEIANQVYATSLDLQKPLNSKRQYPVEIPYSKSGYSAETLTALTELGIKTTIDPNLGEWTVTQKDGDHINLQNKNLIENLMPNVVSMGLKDAIYLLENMGLQVEVIGRGSIRKQSIDAGTRIQKGQKVILEMSFVEG